MRKIKLFLSLLMVMLLSVGNVWAAETEFSWEGSATATSGTTDYVVSESPITLTFSKGTNNNAPRTNKEGAVRMYAGTTLTISSSSGNITRVVFTPTTNSYQASNLTYNSTALTGNDWTLGTPAASVTLTATANARFKSMVVYTAGGGSIAVTGVTLDETAISLGIGENQTLTATVAPNNATNKNVSWASNDEDVATVADGVVTAVAEGTANITVTTQDGNKQATCVVTVTPAPAASNWQATAPADLATGDVVVLTMNVNGTYYAASNDNGTSSAPSATSVAVTGSNLSATPATTLQWTVTVVSEGVFQFAVGDKKLYCTDTNNGVRVGTDPNTTFCNTFDIHTATNNDNKLYLHATTLTRYLGVYNNADWRCYGSVNTNIKNGSLVIFKENDNREAAGLEFATKQYLIKKNTSFSAPELTNQHGLTVTYTSSNEAVAEVAANGAITIKADATGAATITASFDGDETYKDGSASYTIFVAEKAGTNEEGEILTEAIAKELIDLGCTLDVYVTGTILTPQYYDQSKTYTVTLTDGFQFYYFYAGPNETTFDENILTAGDVLVAYGNLKKSGNNYRLNPCYMVSREPYAEQKVDISNTEETAYTPAYAIQLYNDPTSDLTKEVYVKGVVVATPALKYNGSLTGDAAVYNGTYNVYVKAEDDESENPTKFEFFRMYADDNNTTFEDGDIQVGEVIITKGILSKYNSTYEFAQGCQMVSKKSKATMTFDDLEMVVNDEETLAPKTITLATAEAVTYAIKEGSDDCITLANGVVNATAEGTATIVATVATVEAYIGTSVEFTVTVSAAAPVLTDYYEKVTATENITDGTYLIVYEGDNTHTPVAFNGALETLEAVGNNIPVTITNDKKIAVSEATAAATFFLDVDAGTILSKSGKYIGANSYGNRLDQSDEANTYVNALSIDDDGNAVISISNTSWDGDLTLRYNYGTNNGERFRYYKSGQQPIALYKLANEVVKASPELAWSGDVEITLGDDFTAPTLSHKEGFTGTITFASDNESLATVSNTGVIELVADATGTAHITASFAGNDDYKAMSVTCTITVNAAPTPAETKNVVILAEYNSKFYAMTNDLNSGALTAIEITKDGDNIVVPSAEAKAAIQWKMTDNTTTATFQDAEDKYLAHTGTGTSLMLQDADTEEPEVWTLHTDGYYYAVEGRTFFYYKDDVFKNYSVSNLPASKTDYSGAPEIRVIAAENIEVVAPATHTLSYNANGGTLIGGETAIANAEVAEGAKVTVAANVYEKEGYVFAGWLYGETVYNAGQKFDMPAEDVELVAQWTVMSTDNVVILAKCQGQWYAVQGVAGASNHTVAAVPVVYENNTIYLVESKRASITWERTAAGTLASFKNGENYLSGKTSDSNDLDLSEDECLWTYNSTDEIYQTHSAHSLLYSSQVGLFKNYKTSNKSTDGGETGPYSALPIVVPAVFGDPAYTTVREELAPNAYYTMCLDKAVDAVQGGSVWKIVSKAQGSLDIILEEVTGTLDAGRPYIFYATSDIFEVVYAGSAVIEPVDDEANNGLVGSFSQVQIANVNTNYIIYNNELYYVNTDNVYVGAHRAYIDMTAVPDYSEPQQGNAPRRRVTMHTNAPQVATGMDELNASETPVKMIIDGQLYILRGDKMYDATGRLVK